ncbi:hypothetical protein [Alkalihalobacterium bogoriense]|uniref:hypothetical protein n=1 Tax=Alkalihalobacterium bogoriense TaxID=246272 RepID=UPI000A59F96F|nr:hypothetical protein [Alkalihalobacterium bogoriense]
MIEKECGKIIASIYKWFCFLLVVIVLSLAACQGERRIPPAVRRFFPIEFEGAME